MPCESVTNFTRTRLSQINQCPPKKPENGILSRFLAVGTNSRWLGAGRPQAVRANERWLEPKSLTCFGWARGPEAKLFYARDFSMFRNSWNRLTDQIFTCRVSTLRALVLRPMFAVKEHVMGAPYLPRGASEISVLKIKSFFYFSTLFFSYSYGDWQC